MSNKAHRLVTGKSNSDGDRAAKELVSGRIGPSGQRTFHCHVEHVHVGGGTAAIDYLERAGDFEDKGEDLVWVIGDTDLVREAAWQVDRRAQKRNGPTAEKVLSKITFELPIELNEDQQADVAGLVVQRFLNQGYEACAAVHARTVQPHVHVALVSRPAVHIELKMWDVWRDPEKVFLRGGKQALRKLRHEIANDINEVLGREYFHGGRHKDVGIDRKGKRRIPQRLWRQNGVRDNDPNAVLILREHHERQRHEARIRAHERRMAEKERRCARVMATPEYRRLERRNEMLSKRKQKKSDQKRHENEQAETVEIEVVEGMPVSINAEDMDRPATMKQIRYLEDLAKKHGRQVLDNFVPSQGAVGATIRSLMKMPIQKFSHRGQER